MFSIILNAALLLTASAYLQPRHVRYAALSSAITRQDMSLLAIKPDLFSGIKDSEVLAFEFRETSFIFFHHNITFNF